MEITEHAINVLTTVATEVQARFTDFTDLAHGFEHTQRVYHLALILSEKEHADSFIVGIAALLHDLGRTTRGPTHSHAQRSAKLATKLLAAYDLPPETLHAIRHAILAHNYRHGTLPATLEERVLYDADRLDSLGACGVMRWAMTAKRGRWPETSTYHPDDPFALWRDPDGQQYLLDRFFIKLLKLQEAMTTATGRAMPEEVTYRLLWVEKREEEQQEKQAEDLQRGRVVPLHHIYDEQHSA